MTAAFSRFAKAGPPIPDPSPRRRLPRWAAVAALASALAIATAVLVAGGGTAATPAPGIPPAGSVVVAFLQSDGMALLPVGIATVPPLACDPGGTR